MKRNEIDENNIEHVKEVLYHVQNTLAGWHLKGCLEHKNLSNDEAHAFDSLWELIDSIVGGWEPGQLTPRAADKPSAPHAWSPCSQCGSMGYCTHRDPAYR